MESSTRTRISTKTKLNSKDILNDMYIVHQKVGTLNKRIYKELGSYSEYMVNKHFGSFTKAMIQMNLENLIINSEDEKDVLKQKITQKANEIFAEVDNFTKEIFLAKSGYTELQVNITFNTFSDMMKELGFFKFQQANKEDIATKAKSIFKLYGDLNEDLFFKNTSYTAISIDATFGTFEQMLKDIDLYEQIQNLRKEKIRHFAQNRRKYDTIRNFTKEEAIQKAIELFEQDGEVTKESFLTKTNYDKKELLMMFGTFTNLLKEANLYTVMHKINLKKHGNTFPNNSAEYRKTFVYDFTQEDAVKMAKDILAQHHDLNKVLFLQESRYHRETFFKMFGTFRNFIQKTGLYAEVKAQRNDKNSNVTKAELVQDILDHNQRCEGKFTSQYYYQHSKYTRHIVAKHFGSFNKMLQELNLKINTKTNISRDDVKTIAMNLYQEHGSLTQQMMVTKGDISPCTITHLFGSFSKILKELNIKPKQVSASTKQLIDDLADITQRHGEVNITLIENEGKYPTSSYLTRLGGLEEIAKMFNISNLYNSSISKASRYCMYLISTILNTSYESEKTFDWLVNPLTNTKLRLDGYFDEFKLAVEYDGKQHYEDVKVYNHKLSLAGIQRRDGVKTELLKEHGVKLLRVRYDEQLSTVHLSEKLKLLGIISGC